MRKNIMRILLAVMLAAMVVSCGKDSSAPAPGDSGTALDATDTTAWPMFRGNPASTGVAESQLPERLELLWTHRSESSVQSAAAIVNDIVFVGTDDAGVLALDLATGKPKWKYPLTEPVVAAPCVSNGRVFFGDLAGMFHAVDARTGKVVWTVKTDAKIISPANFSGKNVVVGSYDNNLYCFSQHDGSPQWKHQTDNFVNGGVCVFDGRLAVVGCDGIARIIEADTGEQVTTVELGAHVASTPACLAGRIYVATYDGRVVCIDVDSKETIWDWKPPETTHFTASVAVTDEVVIVGGSDGKVWCLDAQSGHKVWVFETRAEVNSSAAISGGLVYLGSDDGNVYALSLTDGKEKWRFAAGAAVSASPAIARRRLIISNEDGTIYCFGGKSRPNR